MNLKYSNGKLALFKLSCWNWRLKSKSPVFSFFEGRIWVRNYSKGMIGGKKNGESIISFAIEDDDLLTKHI